MHLNVEIKARCAAPDQIRKILLDQKADFKGTDEQEDTYFNVPEGRLKLRLGPIEKSLIFYQRSNQAGPKVSEVTMVNVTDNGDDLKRVLDKALGKKVVVKKTREIYFIDNVKFHIDTVPTLGSFIEIEAIDFDGSIGQQKLDAQCKHYINLFGIQDADLLCVSYSDMLLDLQRQAL
ncbi:MAG: class IV adenylate cyclase [Chitinophagaceae bacterium]